jgi:hypothetical protein
MKTALSTSRSPGVATPGASRVGAARAGILLLGELVGRNESPILEVRLRWMGRDERESLAENLSPLT